MNFLLLLYVFDIQINYKLHIQDILLLFSLILIHKIGIKIFKYFWGMTLVLLRDTGAAIIFIYFLC